MTRKCTTDNVRFCVSGGVCPPKLLCNFASFAPARAFVSRHPRKAAASLAAILGSAVGK